MPIKVDKIERDKIIKSLIARLRSNHELRQKGIIANNAALDLKNLHVNFPFTKH